MKNRLFLGTALLFLGVILTGCRHHQKSPVQTAHVGELVYVNDELWPICSSIDKMQEFESKIRSGEIIYSVLTDMMGSCQSTRLTAPARVRKVSLVPEKHGKEYFYYVQISDGISGWTTDKLWAKKK